MSEFSYRKYLKAETAKDISIDDMLRAVVYTREAGRKPEEKDIEDDPASYCMVIRGFMDEDGCHYRMDEAGKFNIAEKTGLLYMILDSLMRDS